MREFTGEFQMMEAITPEAMRAQRQAELAAMVRWRVEKLEAYKAWSQPEARIAREKELVSAAAAAFERGMRMAMIAKEQAAEKRLALSTMKVTPLYKPKPKRSWWWRLIRRLCLR